MARHRKRLAILLLAYAGAVCAAFSGWFGGRAFEIVMAHPELAVFGPHPPELVLAYGLFAGAVTLGLDFSSWSGRSFRQMTGRRMMLPIILEGSR